MAEFIYKIVVDSQIRTCYTVYTARENGTKKNLKKVLTRYKPHDILKITKNKGATSSQKEKKMLKLDKSFTLTVPLFDNDGNATPQAVYDRLNAITRVCGGNTVQKVYGEWISDDGTLYADENAVYTWNFGDDETEELEYKFNLAILGLFSILNQEAVMFKLGETAYIQERHASDFFRGMESAIQNYLRGEK